MRRQRPPIGLPPVPPGRAGTGAPLPANPPVAPSQYLVATNQSDAIATFLASGGYTFWPAAAEGTPEPFFPAGDGAQLVTSVYVPHGRVGFIKEIRIAPLKPSILQDVWNTTGLQLYTDAQFGTFESQREVETYTGLWDVPLGWESYDVASVGALSGGYIPDPWARQLAWQWQLTMVPGPLVDIRSANNIPPFTFLDPVSWYLVDSIPVPASVYRTGFPGRPAGPLYGPQRYQVCPGDSLKTHVIIPENTTACLWARWYNVVTEDGIGVELHYRRTDEATSSLYGVDRVPVIGPSVGSMHGYVQPLVSHGSNENAIGGWGG